MRASTGSSVSGDAHHRHGQGRLRVLGACLLAAVFYRYADSNAVRELPRHRSPGPSGRRRPTSRTTSCGDSSYAYVMGRTESCAWLRSRRGCARENCSRSTGMTSISSRRSFASGRATPAAQSGRLRTERRDVDLISDVVEFLTGWRGEHEGSIGDLVFPGRERRRVPLTHGRASAPPVPGDGSRRDPPGWAMQETRTFHSFRHTFAKRALESGAQITWLSRHLGHSSLKVTTDIYGHWERAERKDSGCQDGRRLPSLMMDAC